MGESAIAVRSLRYTYRGSTDAVVRDVSFEVPPGEIFGFLGPSGAGKSTTQNILIRLLGGYQGTVRVLGRDLREWDRSYYRSIGVSFEAPNHYLKLTARENLHFFSRLYGGPTEDPDTLLESVGLLENADKRVSEFSKGMRGRLTLARALLHHPVLLFLDEPTAGLDPVTSRRIRELIRQTRERGSTVFLTTHDMAVADELCDRVGFLVDGRIATIGAPRALRFAHGRRVVKVETAFEGEAPTTHHFPIDELADNPEFFRLLRSNSIQTIHTLEPNLEEVFVRMTGRSLA